MRGNPRPKSVFSLTRTAGLTESDRQRPAATRQTALEPDNSPGAPKQRSPAPATAGFEHVRRGGAAWKATTIRPAARRPRTGPPSTAPGGTSPRSTPTRPPPRTSPPRSPPRSPPGSPMSTTCRDHLRAARRHRRRGHRGRGRTAADRGALVSCWRDQLLERSAAEGSAAGARGRLLQQRRARNGSRARSSSGAHHRARRGMVFVEGLANLTAAPERGAASSSCR